MPISGDFGFALVHLREGRHVRRARWNESVWVGLQVPDAQSKMGAPYLYINNSEGNLIPYTPGQDAILAGDWVLEQ